MFTNIYKKLVIDFPKFTLALIFILLSFSVFHAKNFNLDASSDALLLEGDPDLKYLRKVNETYGSKDFLVLTYTPVSSFTEKETILNLQLLKSKIEKLTWVDSVITVIDVPLLKSTDEGLMERLKNYKTLINNGHINIDEDKIYDVLLEVSDSYNNVSNLNFKLKYADNKSEIKTDSLTKEKSQTFYWYKKNEFSDKNCRISINKNYLYETIDFKYLEKDSISATFSNIHQCHYDIIPLHKAAKISIRANVPSYLKDKVYIAKLKNDKYYYFGGKWENNFLTTKIGEFGDFAVVADTINPTIRGVNLYPGKTIKKQRTIKYIIDDKESGIKKFTRFLRA